MYKFIMAFLCLCLLVGCGNNTVTSEDAGFVYNGDTISVKKDSPLLKQISSQKAHYGDFSAEFRTVGTVRAEAGKLAEIASPFAGRIVKSFVKLGQKVSVGSPVFEIGSADFYEATKEYFSARSAADVAQRNYDRQKDLAVNGVVSQKDLELAGSESHIAGQELEQSKAKLRIFNIDVTSLRMGQPLKVVSPIAGDIVKCDITIGGYVKEDSGPLAVVADLSNVWVTALVKEKYFGAIKKGDRVEIYTDAHPHKVIWGTIYNIGEVLDEETRSLEVIVECNNRDRELKLGMFCSVHFLSTPAQAIILPSSSVMQLQDSSYVLIDMGNGRFLRRKVETESVSKDKIRIINGVEAGENVVVKGGILLDI